MICALYSMILYLNDGRFTAQELAGMGVCAGVVLAGSLICTVFTALPAARSVSCLHLRLPGK